MRNSDLAVLFGDRSREMAEHQALYEQATEAYTRARRGLEPDRNWRAFLWLVTVRPGIWAKVAPHVDMPGGCIEPEAIGGGYWSCGEHQVVRLALALYSDAGEVAPAALATLDDDLWGAVIRAFELYRGGR